MAAYLFPAVMCLPSFRGARSANPESIAPNAQAEKWIPGSALRAAPE
ncbi:hypothetical protein [Bradyrhizobium sp. USDA 10063]